MITDWGRQTFKGLFEAIADVLLKLHLTPNVVTFIGFLINLLAALFIIQDKIFVGGLLYILAGFGDAIDGTLARKIGVKNKFGAFWDSTLDRLSESVVMGAIGYWSILQGSSLGAGLAFLALISSYMVSYTRARGEGLGVQTKVGFGTRVERYIILSAALVLGYPLYGLALIALLAGVTVLQRIYDVWRQMRSH